MGMHGAGLFRRDALLAVDKYDRTLGAAEDYDLCLRLSRRFPVACHRNVVAEYRLHEGNMSLDSRLMLRECLRALRKQKGSLVSRDERAAFRAGVRHWQDTFGRLEWDTLRHAVIEREIARAVHTGLGLLRHAPGLFMVRTLKYCGRSLRSLAWGRSPRASSGRRLH
jgi:hypothetical protein